MIHTIQYRHPDWKGTNRKPIPLLGRHSTRHLADEIENALSATQAQVVLLIGKSGTGKSTLVTTLAHYIHTKPGGKKYQVKWYSQDDIKNFVHIVEDLQKGLNYILIFDDASYVLDELPPNEVKKIAKKLTYIRHDIGGDVLTFVDCHYSKAFQKFFRDTFFTILTSMTDNERTNIQQLFCTHNSFKVNNFIRIFRQMLFKGFFSFTSEKSAKNRYTYKRDDPFRPALVSSIGSCHHVLYPRESCGICVDPYQSRKLQQLNSEKILADLHEIMGPASAKRAIMLYSHFSKNLPTLSRNLYNDWRLLYELDQKYNINWEKTAKLAEIKIPERKKGYKFKKQYTQALEEIEKERKRTEKLQDYKVADDTDNDSESMIPRVDPTDKTADIIPKDNPKEASNHLEEESESGEENKPDPPDSTNNSENNPENINEYKMPEDLDFDDPDDIDESEPKAV